MKENLINAVAIGCIIAVIGLAILLRALKKHWDYKETLHNRETEVFIAGLMLIIASFGLYIKTKM